MSHAWGDAPKAETRPAPIPGASTARLVDNERLYDRYTGQPQQSNIPVRLQPISGDSSPLTKFNAP